MASTVTKSTLNRTRMLCWLEELDASKDVQGLTIFLRPDATPAEIEKHLEVIPSGPEMLLEYTKLVRTAATGTVIFWTEKQIHFVHPPFPVAATCLSSGIDIQPLYTLVSHDCLIGLILVRLGAYAVGVARDEKLVSSKVGTGNIHGRHRQGGSSANRFRRHREKQTEYFMTRLCSHAREHLEPHLRDMDYMVYGGAWTTIELLKKQCEFISRIKTPELPPLLDIPDPRLPVLEKAVTRVWSSTVYEWHDV